MSQPESLVKLLHGLFPNFLSDMHRHTHTITYAYAGLPQIIFEVDELIYRFIYTACVCHPGSHGQITVIQNGNPMGTDQYLKYHMLGVDDI